jgi:hypothetical protein
VKDGSVVWFKESGIPRISNNRTSKLMQTSYLAAKSQRGLVSVKNKGFTIVAMEMAYSEPYTYSKFSFFAQRALIQSLVEIVQQLLS